MSFRKILVLAVCFLFFLLRTYEASPQQPVINSFSPDKGNMGSSVTITGSNFSTTISNNVVYFGSVRATVTAATNNSLTVTVPKGASYEYITVTVLPAGLSAYSPYRFLVTFPGGDEVFNANSFETVYSNFLSSGAGLNDLVVGDIDNDGRVDAAAVSDPGGNSFELALFRNTTSNNQFSFAPPLLSTSGGYGGRSICFADIDGDGLPDVLVGSFQRLSIFRNLSIPGSISLASPFQFTNLSYSAYSICVNDIDRDGKPDIVIIDSGRVSILKNNSTPSNIALANPVVIEPNPNNTASTEQITIADFDGDLKPDIAVSYFYIDSFYTFRNLSTPGSISFERPTMYFFGANSSPHDICSGDFDNDGKQDLLFVNNDRLNYYKNNTTGSNILFSPFGGYVNLFFSQTVKLSDMNGDGSPDINTNHSFGRGTVIANKSRPCTSSFSTAVNYGGSDGNDLLIADVTGDGKPDMLARSSNNLVVLKNTVGQTAKVCSGTNISIASSLSGAIYQWQQNTGSGYVNVSDGANLSGTATASLQVINAPPAWNGHRFRCVVNTDTSNAYTLSVITNPVPTISISACPSSVCAGSSQNYSTLVVNAGNNPAYQWQDSITVSGWTNIPGATSSSLSYSAVNGVKIRCLLTSSFSCASPSQAISNVVLINIAAPVTPSVSISTPGTTVCGNANVAFTATPVNGNSPLTIPFYQWQVNGANAGRNSPIFNTSSLTNGAQVKVIMTSTANCPTTATATSNTITMTVSPVLTPALTISGNTTVIQGQSASLTSSHTNGGATPSYQWQDSTNTHTWQNINGATNANINYIPAQTGNKIRCLLTSNAACTSPNNAISNVLTFTVSFPTAINPVSANNYGIKYFPNPVNTIFYIDSLKLSDKWQTLSITALDGRQILAKKNIVNQPVVSVNVNMLPGGVYIAVLRGRNNKTTYLKFVKQ